MPPHGYLASSPQAPPYIWGHIMPPYGAPHPYLAMYPHGGMYAHSSMPPGSYPYGPYAMPSANGVAEAPANNNTETNGKSSERKEKLPIKRSKGSLGSLNMITGKNNESNKANGSYPKSGESGSEGSSEGSDANSDNNSQIKSGSRQDSMEGAESQNGNSVHSMAIVPISLPNPVSGGGMKESIFKNVPSKLSILNPLNRKNEIFYFVSTKEMSVDIKDTMGAVFLPLLTKEQINNNL
ncbi:hypothetical protein LXL04_037525 [Taraxacum kok-saghyz]